MTRAAPALLLAAFMPVGAMAAGPPPARLCEAAVRIAEREAGLPADLLAAIAQVESGRGGGLLAWPWTINAEGTGRYFASQAEAVAAVRELLTRGVRLIDVGCLQVNLYHHPQAFASLEEAFEPLRNARYAAGFLRRLHAASGDWLVAAGHYHSTTLPRAEAYRTRVLAAWPSASTVLGPGVALRRLPLAAPPDPATLRRDQLAQAWMALRPDAAPAASLPAAAPTAGTARGAMIEAWGRSRTPSPERPAPR